MKNFINSEMIEQLEERGYVQKTKGKSTFSKNETIRNFIF